MSYSRIIRSIANVANLSTPLGLALGLVGRGRFRRRDQLVVVDQVKLPLINAGAITVGSVVLVPDVTFETLEERIPTVLQHEDEHAWQWAYCLGLPLIPCYLAATAWSMLRCGDRSSANHFEVQAGLESGGYIARPTRTVREGWAAFIASAFHREASRRDDRAS